MKTSLTIGQRIAFGFALILLVMGIVGGLAAYNMKRASHSAHSIAEQSVPENTLVYTMKSSLADARVAARDYALTYDGAYIAKARKSFDTIFAAIAEGRKLVAEYPELTRLAEGLNQAEPPTREYADLVIKMEEAGNIYLKNRAAASQIAVDLNVSLGKISAEQKERFDQEAAKAGVTAAQLAAPFLAYQNAAELHTEVNLARVSNWKAQTMRDIPLFDTCIAELTRMEKRAADLMPHITSTVGKAELQTSATLIATYKGVIGELKASFITFAETSKRRTDVGIAANKRLSEIEEASVLRVKEAAGTSSDNLTHSTLIVIIGIAAAFALGLALALFITRSTSKVLTRVAESIGMGADQTTAAAAQVSASSQSLANGTTEQAASLEETSASLEEMASMTKRNAEGATQAKDLAAQTRGAADVGAADMNEMKSAMDAIKASSGEIAKIVKTIDEIAFQTNILALNAAVEAARAGEAGAGFAVVAEEVRNLAQRSAQAAKETATRIEDSVSKSDNGVRISAKVAESLQQIVDRARQMDSLVAEIASASREQTQGITQVNSAVAQMDKVTQANAGNAEETAAAAEELSAQAAAMQEVTAELRRLVGATQQHGTTAPAKREAAVVPAPQAKSTPLAPAAKLTPPKRGQQPLVLAEAGTNGNHDDFFKAS